jgi:hypothetical protein
VGLFFTKSEVSSAQAPAIIQDFTAHWEIKNKQMVNVWTFDSVRIIYDSGIESNFQTFAICLFFIAEWAVKS